MGNNDPFENSFGNWFNDQEGDAEFPEEDDVDDALDMDDLDDDLF